jgi:phage regulator Rha-like protein
MIISVETVIRDDMVFVGSRQVAEAFERGHGIFLSRIDKTVLGLSAAFVRDNFESCTYVNGVGEKRREIFMTRAGLAAILKSNVVQAGDVFLISTSFREGDGVWIK